MKATVRGFLYQTKDGDWILSEDPQLKSCCINAPGKMGEQIVLDGEFQPSGRAVDVKGTLQIVDGRIHLTHAEMVPIAAPTFVWLVGLSCLVLFLTMWMRRKRHVFHPAP